MRVTSAIGLASVLLSAGSAVAFAPALFAAGPAAVGQLCTESAGTVSCANGYAGFRGPSGKLWIGKDRRGTVIVSIDDRRNDQEPSRREQDHGRFVLEQAW
jgi:hypothetical protein